VALVAVLIVALILGLVLGEKSDDKPNPPPVPPTPPGPTPNTGYNIYYLNDSDVTPLKNMVSGVLTFDPSAVSEEKFLEKTKTI
jgi:hypothetical protein